MTYKGQIKIQADGKQRKAFQEEQDGSAQNPDGTSVPEPKRTRENVVLPETGEAAPIRLGRPFIPY